MALPAANAPRLAEFMAASPETLGLVMLEADPHGGRLKRSAQLAAVAEALADGAGTARDLQQRFPDRTPQELARALKVGVETTEDDPLVGSIWRFAEYQ